MFILFKNL